jgi:hypothetical protein
MREVAAFLGRLEPQSDGIHASGEIRFTQQPATEHDVSQGQQLLLGCWRPTVQALAKLIFRMAPF